MASHDAKYGPCAECVHRMGKYCMDNGEELEITDIWFCRIGMRAMKGGNSRNGRNRMNKIKEEEHNSYEIDKGIPLKERRGGGSPKYPFKDMEVGDSFFIKCDGGHVNKRARAVSKAGCVYGKKTGTVFTIRNVDNGVRVWRVE